MAIPLPIQVDDPTTWPICALCGKRVDRVDIRYRVFKDEAEFTVSCHGTSESATLTGTEMRVYDPRVDRAFVQAGLPEPQKKLET
jgi:hypothetical protein